MNSAEETRIRFAQEIGQADDQINLARAALLIARQEYLHLDVAAYLRVLDMMADEMRPRLRASSDVVKIVEQMNHYLFDEWKFVGNLEQYYDPKNSFLNDVIDRRTGIPITLSVIYLELGWRLGLLLAGVGFPGHFMVKAQMPEGDIVIDPFNHGRFINDETCRQLLDSLYQHEIQFHPSLMMVVNKRQILTRMLTNLKGIYLQQADLPRALAVIDRLVLLTPEDPTQIRDRGIVSYGLNQYSLAYQDLRTYLHYCPTAQDAELIREYLATIRQRMSALN